MRVTAGKVFAFSMARALEPGMKRTERRGRMVVIEKLRLSGKGL